MRIENIAESEVAMTKLKLVREMSIYIRKTKLRKILDLTAEKFQSVRDMKLILEDNPYLDLKGLSVDGKRAFERLYDWFEIRGRGLKSFHEKTLTRQLVLRYIPEKFEALNDCNDLHADHVTIEGSLPSPCKINPRSYPASYSLINVNHIGGETILDPKIFCQTHMEQYRTSIVNSTVVLPEGCFTKKGIFRQVIQADVWNLQKNCILEISSTIGINGFEIPFRQDETNDRMWRSRSPEDCKHFCFGANREMERCDENEKNQSNFLYAFCLRNKFGKAGDKYMENVCDYKGPLTLEEKLRVETGEVKEENSAASETKNEAETDAVRPSHTMRQKLLEVELFNMLILNLVIGL